MYLRRVGSLGVGAAKRKVSALRSRVDTLEVGASQKTKLVLGNRLEPGELKIGVFINGWSHIYIVLDSL